MRLGAVGVAEVGLVDGSTVGINDAPAPMQASVGIAMASGSDVARESADVMLIGNGLMTVANTLALVRRCRRIIIVSFAGTIAFTSLPSSP